MNQSRSVILLERPRRLPDWPRCPRGASSAFAAAALPAIRVSSRHEGSTVQAFMSEAVVKPDREQARSILVHLAAPFRVRPADGWASGFGIAM